MKTKQFEPVYSLDLKEQYQKHKDEINSAVLAVFERTSFILGPEVKELEEKTAKYLNTGFSIGVASGTDALHLALRALDIGPGDEVITTPFTFFATSEVIGIVGATPVFVDVDTKTFNIDPEKIEKAITSKTKAILVVHLYGQSADMDPIMKIAQKHKITVIEDCAQSFGSDYKGRKTGSIGSLGCYSFFPTKNLGAYGDGGLVTTSDKALAEKVNKLRVHGSAGMGSYYYEMLGLNSRLDTIQAAVLLVKLKYIDEWNRKRREIAMKYNKKLKGLPVETPFEAPDRNHIYHQYTLKVEKRDELMEYLKEKGIHARIYYPMSLHLQHIYKELGFKKGDLPNSEMLQESVLSLPMYPELQDDKIEYVTQNINDFYSKV